MKNKILSPPGNIPGDESTILRGTTPVHISLTAHAFSSTADIVCAKTRLVSKKRGSIHWISEDTLVR